LVVLPLYLARVGTPPAVIGGFFTASGAMTAVLVAFSGLLADRFGRRRFLIAGTVLPIASYLIFAATTDVPWLIVASALGRVGLANGAAGALTIVSRSEEHTFELQSPYDLVCRLLLEKKKDTICVDIEVPLIWMC